MVAIRSWSVWLGFVRGGGRGDLTFREFFGTDILIPITGTPFCTVVLGVICRILMGEALSQGGSNQYFHSPKILVIFSVDCVGGLWGG